ncbi:hypothetical protein HOD75_00220 [archaeon]|jgi:hypothetical protein|nr:hypothetical protein [archaeon]MBT4241302.1 hypothetical protein [archaeon]MBT4418124.1 hypothetical protein [archaeon]
MTTTTNPITIEPLEGIPPYQITDLGTKEKVLRYLLDTGLKKEEKDLRFYDELVSKSKPFTYEPLPKKKKPFPEPKTSTKKSPVKTQLNHYIVALEKSELVEKIELINNTSPEYLPKYRFSLEGILSNQRSEITTPICSEDPEKQAKLEEALKRFGDKSRFDLDTPALLEEFRKNPHIRDLKKQYPSRSKQDYENMIREIKKADFSNYWVRLNHGIGYPNSQGFSRNRPYRDAPFQFFLMRDQSIVANIGFEAHEKGIHVSQIQGVPGEKAHLKAFKWPRALLRLATDWASQYDFEELQVLPSHRNKWIHQRKDIRGLPHQLKLIYDVSAKREGFEYDSERELWIKPNRVLVPELVC